MCARSQSAIVVVSAGQWAYGPVIGSFGPSGRHIAAAWPSVSRKARVIFFAVMTMTINEVAKPLMTRRRRK